MRIVIAVACAALLSIALAFTLPPDASMFVTDDDGVIVGVGRSHAGETFFLDVIASYQGFARLVIVTSGGAVEVHDVVVTQGIVLIEFVDLRDIATRSGFAQIVVTAIDVVDTAYALQPTGLPGSSQGRTPAMDRAGSVDAPSQPAGGTADHAPLDAPSAAPPPGASPPSPPIGPPASVTEPPVVPGPPASTPGLPSGPPAHGPSGAQGGGQGNSPHGPDAPALDGEDAEEPSDDERPAPPGQNRRP